MCEFGQLSWIISYPRRVRVLTRSATWTLIQCKSESTPIPRHVPAPKSAINISAPRVVEPAQPEAVGDGSLARRMDKLRRQKPVPHCQCHRSCSWFRPPAPAMVSAEQVPYRPGPVCSQPPSMGSSCRPTLWVRTTTVDDAYCRGLSPHPTTRRTESIPQCWRSSRRMAWQDKQTLEESPNVAVERPCLVVDGQHHRRRCIVARLLVAERRQSCLVSLRCAITRLRDIHVCCYCTGLDFKFVFTV